MEPAPARRKLGLCFARVSRAILAGRGPALWTAVVALAVAGWAAPEDPPAGQTTAAPTAPTPDAPHTPTLAPRPRPTRRPTPPDSTGQDISLRDLGYTGNITVKGIFPTHTFRFPKLQGTTILGKGSLLKFRLQHSSALLPESTVTVLVDDVPVFSRFLNVAREAWFDAQIPLADLRSREDQQHLEVELRFFNVVGDDPCQDLSNPAIWAAIHADSSLHLSATRSDQALGLAHVRGLYSDRQSPGVTLVLPDKLAPAEVPAAVWLVSWVHSLVEASGFGGKLHIVRRARFAKGGLPPSHVIFFGTIADLSEYLIGSPPLSQTYTAEFNSMFDQAAEMLPGDALLLVGGTQAASHMFVTGRDAIGLRQAARYIMDRERGPFTGREILIRRLRVQGPPGLRVPPYQVSLRRLGYADQQVRGVAKHVVHMSFKRADLGPNVGGVSFTAGGAHSSFLGGGGSTMTILFNQVPVKAVPLTGDSDRIDAVRADLPEDLMTPGTNSLDIAFDLLVPSRECTRIWYDQAWASLSADSYFEVKSTNPFRAADLDFRMFPEPFLFETGIVLPDAPDDWELRAAAWMLSAMERMGGTSFNPFTKVFTFGEWRQAAPEMRNLIAIAFSMERMGDFRTLVQPSLRIRGRKIELVTVQGETIYSALTADPLGMAQLFPNPLSSGRGAVLLVLSTTAPRMLAEVGRIFADEWRLKGIQGNVMLVDGQRGVHHYDVGTEIPDGADVAPTWYAGVVKYRTYLLTPALMLLAFVLATLYRKTRGAPRSTQ